MPLISKRDICLRFFLHGYGPCTQGTCEHSRGTLGIIWRRALQQSVGILWVGLQGFWGYSGDSGTSEIFLVFHSQRAAM